MAKPKPETTELISLNLHEYDAGLKRLRIAAAWNFVPETDSGKDPVDADLFCFLLGADSKTREDEDFVFYNNPQGAQLAVRLSNEGSQDTASEFDEVLVIDFDQLSYDVWSIVLGAAIYQGVERDQSFNSLKHGLLTFTDEQSGEELCRIPFAASTDRVTAIKLAQLSRTGTDWVVQEMREGTAAGLGEIAREYGLLISSTS
jgi:tellurium resistance protein TerD